MDTLELPGAVSTQEKNRGLWTSLGAAILRLFGATASQTDGATATRNESSEDRADAAFVIAPGGYRIRVPKPSDVCHSIGQIVPAVRSALNQLPPLPHVVVELLREIQDPNSTAASVAQIVSSDPALAASLIRTVNSASIGISRNITSASEAVSYLGFSTIKTMVIRLRLNEVLAPRTEQAARDAQDLWVHSLATSYAAECLARRFADIDAGFCATLGLLHDIGKLAVLAQLPEQAAALEKIAQGKSRAAPLDAEARVLGVDHAGLGADLAAFWQLPADLIQAMRRHHRFTDAYHPTDPLPLRKALHIVQIANQLAKYCFPHCDRIEIEAIPDEIFTLLGLEPSLSKLLDDRMRAAIGKAIFFADVNAQRPVTAPRRFLRPMNPAQAAELLAAPVVPEMRIRTDDPAIDALFSPDIPVFDDEARDGNRIPNFAQSVGHARFACRADAAAVDQCIKAVCAHQNGLTLSPATRAAAAIVVRSLLPNLLQISNADQTLDVAQAIDQNKYSLAIRCPALAFARRSEGASSPDTARRLAEADLANLLNLGWFERIAVSGDGASLLFAGH